METAAQPGRGERWVRWILIAAGVVRLASMVGEGHIRGWWLLMLESSDEGAPASGGPVAAT